MKVEKQRLTRSLQLREQNRTQIQAHLQLLLELEDERF